MADYELIGLNEAAPDLRAPTSADRGIVVGGVRVSGLSELDGGADINGDPVATVSRTNPLRQASRVAMTAAASGSNGISALDNANLDMGTNNFTLHWEGALSSAALADTTSQRFVGKYQDVDNRYQFDYSPSTQLLSLILRKTAGTSITASLSYAVSNIVAGTIYKWTCVVTRETASTAGSVVFYRDGVAIGTVAISAGTPANIDNTGSFQICGTTLVGAPPSRVASDTTNAIIYNRALSAAEVLSLCVNGPALADIGASQVALISSDFSAGVDGWTALSGTVDGNIDGIGGENDWLRFTIDNTLNVHRASKAVTYTPGRRFRLSFKYFIPSGQTAIPNIRVFMNAGSTAVGSSFAVTDTTTAVSFEGIFVGASRLDFYVASGSAVQDVTGTEVFYIKDVKLEHIGITGQWSAQDAQSDTGQIFDSSGNKNHALLPAAGATIIGKEMSVPKQVRWTNTWSGTNELQYIGGVNQAILPAKAYIESIVGVITGATVEDIIIGDGSDTDRYVTITTGLAAGTVTFTLANRTTDGTNLKLTVDPDANATMSIAWTITYRTLE